MRSAWLEKGRWLELEGNYCVRKGVLSTGLG